MITEFTCLYDTTYTGNYMFRLKLLVLLSFKQNYYKYLPCTDIASSL
jgi:hypothetical protein